ncbi:predicted protein [Naegleria gruberi]|uniref:Predicted protein n=1 Tax=Naegleria gruberi TaxID=5762 RepID=D2VA24_NAEGR|nr:uncharacterized protein NAEGRDRAFT_47863 [Naegleria gruberi]EFC46355.1 predicted protein [Naegleria gruberi]|eukprot:XP_002679099.1 predicted protein [Naegleria gruberi strain NEG-M]
MFLIFSRTKIVVGVFWRQIPFLLDSGKQIIKKMSSKGAWKKKASSSSSSRRRSDPSSLDVEESDHKTTTSRKRKQSSNSGKKSLNLVCSQSDVDSSNSQYASSPSQLSSNSSSNSSTRKKLEKTSPSVSCCDDEEKPSRQWKKKSPSKFSKVIDDESEEEEPEEYTPPKKKKHTIVISDEDDEDSVMETKKAVKNRVTPTGMSWCEKHVPTDISEIWIKPNVVSDFEDWICSYPKDISFKNKPCIVIGPGGSGKRTMVYLMIKKHFGFGRVHIYHPNKINKDEQQVEDNQMGETKNWIEDLNKGPNPNSVISSFRDFLRTTIVKKSLNLSSNSNDLDISYVQSHTNSDVKKTSTSLGGYNVDIIVIEELPPVHTKQQKEKLFQALHYGLSLLQNLEINKRKRLVKFIVLHDHTNSSSSDYDLLVNYPKEFRESCTVVKITKPPKTIITPILKNISRKEKCFSKVSEEDFNIIVSGSNGDLRHAINQLEYFVLGVKNGKMDLFSSPVKSDKLKKVEKQAKKIADSIKKKSKNKKAKEQQSKTFNIHMDIGTTIHHAAARVLYGKRDKNTGILEFNLEKDVLNVYKSEKNIPEQTLTNYVQSNSPYFCKDITALSKSLDAFSLSDSSFGRKMSNTYEDTQQTTTFNEYQFLTTSRAVLYYHQGHIPDAKGLKSVLAPKLVKSVFKEREEKLKQLLLLVKNQDSDESMVKKAYLGFLPFEDVSTFSHLFNLKETLADVLPYLLSMLHKTRLNIPSYLNINEMHRYPKFTKNSLSSSDDIETCDTEADDIALSRALSIKQDMSQSVVSSLVSYLTMGLTMTDDALFPVPQDDTIESAEEIEEDKIEDEFDDEFYAEILDILETEAKENCTE